MIRGVCKMVLNVNKAVLYREVDSGVFLFYSELCNRLMEVSYHNITQLKASLKWLMIIGSQEFLWSYSHWSISGKMIFFSRCVFLVSHITDSFEAFTVHHLHSPNPLNIPWQKEPSEMGIRSYRSKPGYGEATQRPSLWKLVLLLLQYNPQQDLFSNVFCWSKPSCASSGQFQRVNQHGKDDF